MSSKDNKLPDNKKNQAAVSFINSSISNLSGIGEKSLPLFNRLKINTVKDVIKDKESKIYLYCRSGHRSGIALNAMKELGYTDLTNIGGIIHYKGELE